MPTDRPGEEQSLLVVRLKRRTNSSISSILCWDLPLPIDLAWICLATMTGAGRTGVARLQSDEVERAEHPA